MRFHKAVRITRPEADFIIEGTTASCSDVVVMSHADDWYDVRLLNEKELEEFVYDLLRAEFSALEAGIMLPH